MSKRSTGLEERYTVSTPNFCAWARLAKRRTTPSNRIVPELGARAPLSRMEQSGPAGTLPSHQAENFSALECK